MGLDMYLWANKYITGITEWDDEARKWKTNPLADSVKELVNIKDACESVDSGLTIEFPVAYWRKANHIHGWFVENVQNNEDDCEQHYVSRQKLEKLRDTCQLAINTQDSDLIPRIAGFFFGSDEVDEGYWWALENTIKQINKVLSLPDDISLYYQSSW